MGNAGDQERAVLGFNGSRPDIEERTDKVVDAKKLKRCALITVRCRRHVVSVVVTRNLMFLCLAPLCVHLNFVESAPFIDRDGENPTQGEDSHNQVSQRPEVFVELGQ